MALDVVAARRRGPDSPVSPSCAAARDWKVVSQNFASWNQLDGWLRQLDGLRYVA
jgi:hypothetical protein